MTERARRDLTNHVAGYLARNLPEVEGIGADVLAVLMELEAAGNFAVPSPATDLRDLLSSANTLLEMPLPADKAAARETRRRRVQVYYCYLSAAHRRLEVDSRRAADLCVKAGRWGDYARLPYWRLLLWKQLAWLAAAGLRYRFFGTPPERSAVILRQRTNRIISIRSGVAVP